jgi:purine-binding chemotaxis protein CheW
MDILAARKKAAEQASAKNEPVQEAAAPTAQPTPEPEQEAPRASEEPLSGGSAGPPAEASPAPVPEGPGDSTTAAQAATPADAAETRQQEIELLSFRLGGEEYAVLVADVREVLKVIQLTTVPNTPDYILGVTSLRGTMLPIVDLCKRFGLASGVNDEKSRIIVVSYTEGNAGLLVDRVTGVLRILPDEIKPAPENIEQGAEFLGGIVRKDDRLYILLDLEKAVGA